ncbi:hypothetical protein ceV_409 [Chrysochromulina ericina virus CeV-01B]|jgi:hypothetical protein|uniref:Uncharacterized protein n=1 Tax=Chrysochromulina ericina virus CeV-01B TaxID=3070830 RepID=A0A0N9R3W8_9VIRU|nr:hypothetical protein ceV_409 [Chrysochromulina ericina virus]ALH23315.1 hypothetical protein ceV_409 [Chrysochromulina ericina virus CeV-01B]
MDIQEPIEDTKKGFFGYVFNFDDTNTGQLTNLYQYTFIAIPLILLSLKILNHFSSDVDESKGTLEILFEIFISLNWILLTIWFVNKIIRYIPTKSKMSYPIFNETNFILPLLIVLFTMNTKLGNKINLLIERGVDLYDGKTNLKDSNNNVNQQGQKDIKTTQPISNMSHGNSRLPPPPGGVDAVYGIPSGSNNHGAESEGRYTKQLHRETVHSQSQEKNFNNDFSGPNINNLLQTTEPMAANEAFGGNMFGGSVF